MRIYKEIFIWQYNILHVMQLFTIQTGETITKTMLCIVLRIFVVFLCYKSEILSV